MANVHLYTRKIENFLQNMAIEDADPSLVVRWKSLGKWPLPCQMVFVLKPLTQSQQQGDDVQAEYKHKSRLVICGNFASWGEHSTTTTNLDAPLLPLMISLACSKETTWSSVDITSAFLNADIHDDDISARHTTTNSCEDGYCQAQYCVACEEGDLWSSRSPKTMATRKRPEASRSRVQVSEQACSPCPKLHPSKPMVYCRRPQTVRPWGFNPSIIASGAINGQPNCTSTTFLGYVGVYVDDLLTAGPRALNDSLIRSVQDVWKNEYTRTSRDLTQTVYRFYDSGE